MSSVSKSVLIFGATGVIGRYIVDEILKSNKFNVSIFTSPETVERKAQQIDTLKQRGCRVIAGNGRDESDGKAAYEGIQPFLEAFHLI